MQNYVKAVEIAEKQLIFTSTISEESKNYADALYYACVTKRAIGDIAFCSQMTQKLCDVNKLAYGEKSVQYIEALKELAYWKTRNYQLQEAYKYWLKAYDLSTEVHESEVNVMSSMILCEMAAIKSALRLFDDGLNLLEKAKKIEIQMSSVHSAKYKNILNLEKIIFETQAKNAPKKVRLLQNCNLFE